MAFTALLYSLHTFFKSHVVRNHECPFILTLGLRTNYVPGYCGTLQRRLLECTSMSLPGNFDWSVGFAEDFLDDVERANTIEF